MPIHGWTRISSGTIQNFHQRWVIAICDALNAGRLPENCFATAEEYVGRLEYERATRMRELLDRKEQ